MTKLSEPKMVGVVLMICAVCAIGAPAQTFTTLFKFNGSDGANPIALSLIQGADGDLYGSTVQGGTGSCFASAGCGTIFKLTAGASRRSSTLLVLKPVAMKLLSQWGH